VKGKTTETGGSVSVKFPDSEEHGEKGMRDGLLLLPGETEKKPLIIGRLTRGEGSRSLCEGAL
jgi:hypothetical protein